VNATKDRGPRAGGSRVSLRLLGAFAALVAGATAVVVGGLLVHGLPAIASSASETQSPPATTGAQATFPRPPRGAVVFGAESGPDAFGLGVVPGRGEITLQASVLGPQGNGVKGLAVRFDVVGKSHEHAIASATPCGAGCYRASVRIGRPLRVGVTVGRAPSLSFAMPSTWPPPAAGAIIRRAAAAWRNLKTLAYRDRLGDGHVVLETNWKIVAPDRIEFQVEKLIGAGRVESKTQKNLDAGIIIGSRRWDKPAGSTRWTASPQSPVRQPIPFWVSATNAYVLGTVSVDGRPAWKISFFDFPGGPAWFTILVDKTTLHTTQLWMTATAHFMRETYTSFDAPITITPPA
jgi:hypothetical protein